MNIKTITSRIVKQNPDVVRKTPKRILPYVLCTGLAIGCVGGAKAHEDKKDTYQKPATELTTENSNKDEVKGGALFCAALLVWMGAVVLGNKLHDKKR